MKTHKKRVYKTNKIHKNKTYKIYQIPPSDKDIVALIDKRAIRKNIQFLRKKTKTDIMPVLKADAYGHGIIEIAKYLRQLDIKYLGVATVGEAILLRESGDKGRILAWLYDIEGPELTTAFHLDIDIAIFDETHIPIIQKKVPSNKKANITLFVDTGINRASVPYDKAYQAAIDISKCTKFNFVGLMSHLVCSEIKNSPIVKEQFRKFRDLRTRLENIHICPPLTHIANTGGCLNYDVSDFTLCRPGSGIYGISPDPHSLYTKKLHLAMTVKSNIIQLKHVEKGEGIGYNWKYIAPKRIRIGILPIGYADIVPRNTSLQLEVYVKGTKRKVLGLISMDQIMIEARESDQLNEDVYIFGNGQNCPQTIYNVAEVAKTIPLEILCHTGYRIYRKYV